MLLIFKLKLVNEVHGITEKENVFSGTGVLGNKLPEPLYFSTSAV
ncbi:hypothetical protein GCM10008014_31550 [Paenibacillus silvae]|uniref:Uncharacterized protein n=1 Tax=Paenibacillus silvae TaxID=1325358 RepID=A0ABQ1ZCR5_9BACL|nr:hypothetical protein GCM10008014_31550 [Paenibacillus silvae]